MGQHEIDAENLPYHPEKLPKKDYVSVNDYFSLDIRAGKIINVENYPEMRKPSYKITVDFGPKIGQLSTSAQITNYSMILTTYQTNLSIQHYLERLIKH